MSIRFILSSPPPSTNNATTVAVIGGRARKIKSAEYRAWLERASWELKVQPGALPDPCYWSLNILLPGSVRPDLDNLEKGIIDALGQSCRTPDDRYLVGKATWFHAETSVILIVKVEDTETWAPIRGASKTLIKRMEVASR